MGAWWMLIELHPLREAHQPINPLDHRPSAHQPNQCSVKCSTLKLCAPPKAILTVQKPGQPDYDHCGPHIYQSSAGGKTVNGWSVDSLPYIVELDNFGESSTPGQHVKNQCWTWGRDEITWFAVQNKDYRNYWLQYAHDWVNGIDKQGIGHLEMPGLRPLADDHNELGLWWFYAGNSAFAVEDTIAQLWGSGEAGKNSPA